MISRARVALLAAVSMMVVSSTPAVASAPKRQTFEWSWGDASSASSIEVLNSQLDSDTKPYLSISASPKSPSRTLEIYSRTSQTGRFKLDRLVSMKRGTAVLDLLLCRTTKRCPPLQVFKVVARATPSQPARVITTVTIKILDDSLISKSVVLSLNSTDDGSTGTTSIPLVGRAGNEQVNLVIERRSQSIAGGRIPLGATISGTIGELAVKVSYVLGPKNGLTGTIGAFPLEIWTRPNGVGMDGTIGNSLLALRRENRNFGVSWSGTEFMGTVGNLSTTLYIGPRKPLLDGAEITGEGSAIAALVAAYEIAVFNATPTKPTTSPGG